MKQIKRACLALICMLLICSCALADQLYLMPGSDTRNLTEAELWEWDRESLSYMINEIMARHGYVFPEGSAYDKWFRQFPWYIPNENPDNQTMVYNVLSNLEWNNYTLIKQVAAQMDANGEQAHNPSRKCYRDLQIPASSQPTVSESSILMGFNRYYISQSKTVAVYSAPSAYAWRGAEGKAEVSTNGLIWAAGKDNGWVLICYETNEHRMRVGYINEAEAGVGVSVAQLGQMTFSRIPMTVLQSCPMTDDPMVANIPMTWLSQGAQITFLTTFVTQDGQSWDYVETYINGQQARGFIPHGALSYLGS